MSKNNKHTKRNDRRQARELKRGIGLPDIDWDALIHENHAHNPYDNEDIYDNGDNYFGNDRDY